MDSIDDEWSKYLSSQIKDSFGAFINKQEPTKKKN